MKIKLIIGAFLLYAFSTSIANDQPVFDDEEHQCLAVAIYKEASGESIIGQKAVGHVVLNRVSSPGFPDSVCGVVKQRTKYTCQFSWFCKTTIERVFIRNKGVIEVARELLQYKYPDVTGGALFFHNTSVSPRNGLVRTKQIGNHIFYRKKNSHGRNNRGV